MSQALTNLTFIETRVLGVLAEKQRTVPDSYPMTLNSLVSGCNQKSSRDPVIEASEAEVSAALDALRGLSLLVESSGGRTTRYAHNIERVLHVPAQSVALLAMLMLRGPQTAGELRINCDRLHRFADISSVESFLSELAEREAGALVVELPRQPGSRENRWMHLLSGIPVIEQGAGTGSESARNAKAGDTAGLEARVASLENELSELRTVVGRLCTELGIASDPG